MNAGIVHRLTMNIGTIFKFDNVKVSLWSRRAKFQWQFLSRYRRILCEKISCVPTCSVQTSMWSVLISGFISNLIVSSTVYIGFIIRFLTLKSSSIWFILNLSIYLLIYCALNLKYTLRITEWGANLGKTPTLSRARRIFQVNLIIIQTNQMVKLL